MNLIGTIFSVLTVIVGGVCIMLFVSTKTLRDSRDDQEKRIKFLEDERARDKATIASQATELQIWQRAVTGEAQLAMIVDILKRHDKDTRANWVVVTAALGHVGTSIDNLVTTLEDNA